MAKVIIHLLSLLIVIISLSRVSWQKDRKNAGVRPLDAFGITQKLRTTKAKPYSKISTAEPTNASSECVCLELPLCSTKKNSTFEYGIQDQSQKFTCNQNGAIKEEETSYVEMLQSKVQNEIQASSLIYNLTKDDSYILRWLRAHSDDQDEAEKSILEHVKLREATKLDFINNDDWSEYKEHYPMLFDAYDRKGRPFAEVHLDEWNLRNAIYKSKREKLMRWWIHMLEMQTRTLNLIEASEGCYKQALIAVDLHGLNATIHACSACLTFYYEIISYMEANYPEMYARIIFINSTPVFDPILKVIKDAMRERTYSRIDIYASKEKWLERIDRLVAEDQRTSRFQGTKPFKPNPSEKLE